MAGAASSDIEDGATAGTKREPHRDRKLRSCCQSTVSPDDRDQTDLISNVTDDRGEPVAGGLWGATAARLDEPKRSVSCEVSHDHLIVQQATRSLSSPLLDTPLRPSPPYITGYQHLPNPCALSELSYLSFCRFDPLRYAHIGSIC